MKTIFIAILTVLSTAAVAAPQSASPTKGTAAMSSQDCSKMMQGMDTKGMDMKGMSVAQCKEMMKGAADPRAGAHAAMHRTVAVVKKIDKTSGTVTLDHQAVKSLNWPAMTMGFAVKEKRVWDKLSVGKKVEVEFVKQGSEYVVISAK